MTRHRRRPRNPKQLGLPLGSEDLAATTETRGVFSAVYLARHLRTSNEFASEQEVSEAYKQIYDLWQHHAIALARRNEAFTCSTFIEPILDLLGWRQIPQEAIPSGLGTRKTPDYCLFTSDSNFTSASQADANTLLRYTATVLEAKKYLHPLNQISTRETPGWYPSQQIQDYLNWAKDSFGKRFFNWAILTNGAEWRLYTDRSAAGAYFAFHMIQSGQFCPLEDFKTFFTLFRASAFQHGPDEMCFLDKVQEQSLRIQADLETNLRKRIFSVRLFCLGELYYIFDDLAHDERYESSEKYWEWVDESGLQKVRFIVLAGEDFYENKYFDYEGFPEVIDHLIGQEYQLVIRWLISGFGNKNNLIRSLERSCGRSIGDEEITCEEMLAVGYDPAKAIISNETLRLFEWKEAGFPRSYEGFA